MIIQLLKQENMTFNQIMHKIDFTHNTLQQNLEKLLDKGLVERRKQPTKSPGRPTYVYKIPDDLKGRLLSTLMNPKGSRVVLSFNVLRRMCRHEKGGYCKEIRGRCRARNCPKTLK
jgi:predicted ArsR family transcriptional regulator